MVQMRQLFYCLAVPMMQSIIQNLVTMVLRAHPDYIFDSQTMVLHLALKPTFQYPWLIGTQSEDLSSPLLYHYPNAKAQIRCYGRDFVVPDLLAYPSLSDIPPSPSLLILEQISDPAFPLLGLQDYSTANSILVVQDSPKLPPDKNDASIEQSES